MKRQLSLATMLAATLLTPLYAAEITTGVDEEAQLPFWQWSEQGISVRLVQRLPDQTRAFFIGRGFDSNAANIIATGCVFQTVFRNDGKAPVDYDLADWTILHGGQKAPMALKEGWDNQWQSLNLPKAARIAFKWALLPNKQHFEPGDYNWGMTSYGLLPEEQFDLNMIMEIDGKHIEGQIKGIECPADREI